MVGPPTADHSQSARSLATSVRTKGKRTIGPSPAMAASVAASGPAHLPYRGETADVIATPASVTATMTNTTSARTNIRG